MTIKNVLLALALATFALAGCTQNTTFGISANVLAFVDEANETGSLTIGGEATVDVLGADGIALSDLSVSENQAAGIESVTLDVAVDVTAEDNANNVTVDTFIYLAEAGETLSSNEIASGNVDLAANEQGTLSLDVEIDADNAAQLEILQSGNAVIGVTLQLTGSGTDAVSYTLQTINLGGSYTPSEALSF